MKSYILILKLKGAPHGCFDVYLIRSTREDPNVFFCASTVFQDHQIITRDHYRGLQLSIASFAKFFKCEISGYYVAKTQARTHQVKWHEVVTVANGLQDAKLLRQLPTLQYFNNLA